VPVSIALCVLTFRRPLGLRELLSGIAALDVQGLDLDVRVVVVDNDPAGTGRAVVDELAPQLPFPVAYDVEPRQGIPLARNRALRVAGSVEFIGWLDDDEVPRPEWLRRLVEAQRVTGAEVVIGPSVPRLPPSTPDWIREGGFFERRRFPSGSRIPGNYARTSGVLVRRSAMPARDVVFREELRFSGGSDRELFVEMERAGARFVWVDDAVVVERVPASRARGRWILQRAFRVGNSRSTTLVLEGATARRRAGRVGKGAVKIVAGAVAAMRGLPRSRATVARGVWQSCYGAGLVTGALGLRYGEYRRHHGA
jgi:succinoglycan biosynthesis protein ExoM